MTLQKFYVGIYIFKCYFIFLLELMRNLNYFEQIAGGVSKCQSIAAEVYLAFLFSYKNNQLYNFEY